MFLPNDLDITLFTVNHDNPESPQLSYSLYIDKPEAVLIFETIPHRTCITFQKAVYNRFPMKCDGVQLSLDDQKRVIECTLDTNAIIQALAEKEISAVCTQDLRPSDCSYISSLVAIVITRHNLPAASLRLLKLPPLSARFGLIQLPLLSAEVCRNVQHRYAPSISRQALVDAIHIICQFA